MIVMSKLLRSYVEGFETRDKAAEHLGVSPSTLFLYLGEERGISSDFIQSVQMKLGWDFEKAFEIKEESK